MAGRRWRLLASFLPILVATAFLRGQDDAAERPAAPTLATPRSLLTAPPIWVPLPPSLPPSFPVGHYPVGRFPAGRSAMPFRQLVRSAGIIFSGHVISIGRAAGPSGRDNPAATTVTFQVEHAIRGTSGGQSLTIHEWAGLWPSGERYHVGERVLLFLYAPSKLGLTSPVAGSMGRFALGSRGEIVMNAQHLATFVADPLLGGKTIVSYADFALAVQRTSEEE